MKPIDIIMVVLLFIASLVAMATSRYEWGIYFMLYAILRTLISGILIYKEVENERLETSEER